MRIILLLGWYGKVTMTYTLGSTGKIVSVNLNGMDFNKTN